MTNLVKKIKKISGYRGPTVKSLIPKSRSLGTILGIKKRKTKLRGIFAKSKKITSKRPKKRLVRNTSRITTKTVLRGSRIGDAKKAAPSLPSPHISTPTLISPTAYILPTQSVIWVKLSPFGKNELIAARSTNVMIYRAIMNDIAKEMIFVKFTLTSYGAKMIAKHVPRDTGELQQSLLASMTSRSTKSPPSSPKRIGQIEIHMGFWSYKTYLKYVNNPKRKITVRHHKNMGIISYRGGRHYLHDPTAKTKFMLTTKQAIRTEAKRLTKKMISNLWNKWKPQYTRNQVKSLFRYPGMGKM
ncbi:hypothetical protein LCGC14_0712220 [marine sediment metagenome]|uniref:Uncharacterized protein n=1 Tax=marine sediment metagenome TaxID=412755 RepID=A0A0F9T0F0_9ZZZZ